MLAGETGGDDAPTFVLGEESPQDVTDLALARRVTLFLGVRAVGEQQANSRSVRQRTETGQVGATTIDRREVDLEVARMQHDSLRSVKCNGVGMGHRMCHRDELDVERPDASCLAVGDRDEIRAAEQTRFFDAVTGKTQRDR